ncbi:MAG: hypothetical protein P0S93_01110 [Candidatus Neptunochlamydia sp.]|nr:hypothetical protein [Candidatus Neptunochlamydia sp.]
MKIQWSPEQISGWLNRWGYTKCVSHETIYKYVWEEKRMGGSLYIKSWLKCTQTSRKIPTYERDKKRGFEKGN